MFLSVCLFGFEFALVCANYLASLFAVGGVTEGVGIVGDEGAVAGEVSGLLGEAGDDEGVIGVGDDGVEGSPGEDLTESSSIEATVETL